MKIFNRVFKSGISGQYTANTSFPFYTATTKTLILSLLLKNNASPAQDITVTAWIKSGNTFIYPLISSQILSSKDEFFIDRTKQLFILNPGETIELNYGDSGIWTYCSLLENLGN